MSDWALYAVLVAAGIAAGIVNTVAGGGSFITLPALMLLGLPASVANGTNRVAILMQSAAASAAFHRHERFRVGAVLPVLLPALAGSIAGAAAAARMSEEILRALFGVLFLVMTIVLILEPRILLAAERPPIESRPLRIAVFFAIGAYGGFIQAGVGIFLLIAMRLLLGRDLVASNGVKNLIVLLYTFAALAVFVAEGKVDWVPGLVLSAGSAIGAHLGAKLAIARGNRFVFVVMIAVMIATGASLVWPFVRRIAPTLWE